jgi:hypothetical protein
VRPYHCAHIRVQVLRYPLLLVALMHRDKVIFETPAVMRGVTAITSPYVPQVAGYCPECKAACGWRAPEAA